MVRPTSPAHALPTHPPRLGPRRAISGHLARSRAISGPRRAIPGDLGASFARRHTCSKRKEVGGRRSRPIQSAVVAGFLAPGSSPDGCCAGQQTIGRRDDAPSGTLPPPLGYCRTSALSGGIFPSRFLGPPATPTDFPSPHLRRNHRRDCRRCAPWRLCMSRVPARQGWCQGQLNCQGWCQGQINCLAGAKAQRLSSLSLLPLHSLNFLPLSPLRLSLLAPPSLRTCAHARAHACAHAALRGTAQVPSRSDSLTLRFPHAQIPCKGVPRYATGRDGVRSCGAGRGLVREGAGKCPRAWGWAPPWGYP